MLVYESLETMGDQSLLQLRAAVELRLGFAVGYTLDAVGPIIVASLVSICWHLGPYHILYYIIVIHDIIL